MKKTLLIAFALLGFAFTAHAQGVQFTEASFDELLAKAKAEDKPLFVDIYATWCGPCVYMANNIFPQAAAGSYFNATFVNAKFDAEKGEGVTLASKYKVRAYPTFLILDGSGNELGRIVGGDSSAEGFVATVKEKMQSIK